MERVLHRCPSLGHLALLYERPLIHTHTHTHTRTCTHARTHAHIYIYIYIRLRAHTHTCTHARTHYAHHRAYLWSVLHRCPSLGNYFIRGTTNIRAHIRTRTHTHTHTHTERERERESERNARIYVHTRTHTHMHTIGPICGACASSLGQRVRLPRPWCEQ